MSLQRILSWAGCFIVLLSLAVGVLFFSLKGKSVSVSDSPFLVPSSPWVLKGQQHQSGAQIFASCASCHMANGLGRKEGSIPALAGQTAEMLKAKLRAFKRGERYSPTMIPFARSLSEQDIDQVASYLSRLPAVQQEGMK